MCMGIFVSIAEHSGWRVSNSSRTTNNKGTQSNTMVEHY